MSAQTTHGHISKLFICHSHVNVKMQSCCKKLLQLANYRLFLVYTDV